MFLDSKEEVTDNRHFQLLYNPSIHGPQTALWRRVKIIIPITQREELRQRELKGFIPQHRATQKARERANRPAEILVGGDFWVSESFQSFLEREVALSGDPSQPTCLPQRQGIDQAGLCVQASLPAQVSLTIPVTVLFSCCPAGIIFPLQEGFAKQWLVLLPNGRWLPRWQLEKHKKTLMLEMWPSSEMGSEIVSQPPKIFLSPTHSSGHRHGPAHVQTALDGYSKLLW